MIVKRVEREKIVISGDEQSAIDVFRGGEPLNYARVSDGLAILDGSVWSGPSIVIRQSGTDRLIAVASDALGFVNEPNEYGGRGHLLDNPLFFGAIANGPERPKVPQSLIDYVAGGGTNESFYRVGAAIAIDLLRFGIVASPGAKVFELGSGCGRIPLGICSALDASQGASYTGFDIYRDGVKWAQQNVSRLYPFARFIHLGSGNKYEAATSYRLDLPTASHDTFVATSVFTHLRFPAANAYVAEIARILKTGGKGYITFFASKEVLREHFERSGTVEDDYGFHYVNVQAEDTYTDENAVIRMMEANGLNVLGIKYGSWRDPANNSRGHAGDLPPLKWSSLKYDFRMEDKINGKEEAYG